jgi:hypothetical protein
MPKFIVPADLHPGVFVAGVGTFRVGATITVPSDEPLPSLKLIPTDKDGVAMLEAGKKAREAHYAAFNADRKSKGEKPSTPKPIVIKQVNAAVIQGKEPPKGKSAEQIAVGEAKAAK